MPIKDSHSVVSKVMSKFQKRSSEIPQEIIFSFQQPQKKQCHLTTIPSDHFYIRIFFFLGAKAVAHWLQTQETSDAGPHTLCHRFGKTAFSAITWSSLAEKMYSNNKYGKSFLKQKQTTLTHLPQCSLK